MQCNIIFILWRESFSLADLEVWDFPPYTHTHTHRERERERERESCIMSCAL